MLLALDAGNTNITIGVFDGAKLIWSGRLRTVPDQTADAYWGNFISLTFCVNNSRLSAFFKTEALDSYASLNFSSAS